MSEELLQPNTPVKFSARNPYPAYRKLRGGDCYKLTVEVEEKVWNQLKTLPVGAILDVVMWFHDGDTPDPLDKEEKPQPEEKPKKERPVKGPYSAYWQAMYRRGFQFDKDLQQALKLADPELVKEGLKEQFVAESLTDIAPDTFETWADKAELHSLVNLSRQVAAKVGI